MFTVYFYISIFSRKWTFAFYIVLVFLAQESFKHTHEDCNWHMMCILMYAPLIHQRIITGDALAEIVLKLTIALFSVFIKKRIRDHIS